MERKGAMKEEKKRMNEGAGGFTLVELIVVLVILSILAAVAVPAVTGFIDDGKAKECQTQMEALAADIATAKMSYEVGDETGDTFDIGTYIAGAGELGKCPSGGEYSVDTTDASQTVITCSLHGEAAIPNSGKFSVTVAAPIPEMPSPAPETPTPTPETPTPTPDTSSTPTTHKYTATIDPGSLNVEVNGTQELHVTVRDEDNNVIDPSHYTVQWSYSGEGDVDVPQGPQTGSSVSATGRKVGRGQISCTVTVEEKDGSTTTFTSDSIDAAVTAPELKMSGPDELHVKKGESKGLGVTATDENGNPYPGKVTYSSSDPSTVTVDESGNVTGVKPGASCVVTVTVTDDDGNVVGTKDVTVTVDSPELKLSGPDELHVKKGESKGLGVTATDENGNPYPGKVTYSSSDPSTVTVDESGNVTGVKPGASCVVTVTVMDDDGNVVGTKDVTVTVDSPELKMSGPDELHVKKGESKGLGVTATDENGNPYPGKVTYSSSDPSTVTVDESGNVTGVKPGASCVVTVTVTDDDGNVVGTKDVTVTVDSPELKMSGPDELQVKEDETKDLGVTATDENGNPYPGKVTYSSSDPSAVTVDENGNVTGVKPGASSDVTVTVTDENGKVVGEKKVTVKVTKAGGILQDSAKLWAEDAGDVTTYNLHSDVIASWFTESPTGGYGLWEYKGNDNKVKLYQPNLPNVTATIEWVAGEKYVLTYTPPGGEPEEIVLTVGYSLASISDIALNPSKSNLTTGEEINVSVSHQPEKPTDILEWELVTLEGDEPATLEMIDQRNAKLRAVSPGKVQVHVFCHRQRWLGTEKEVVEKYSQIITIGEGNGDNQQQETQNQNQSESQGKITSITLNPASMILKEGQSKQLEVVLQTDGDDIDMSKVRYVFSNYNNYALDMTSNDNTAVVTGLVAQQQGSIGVNVYYGNDSLYAVCQVNVIDMPVDQVAIDGNCFGAMSWAEFQANVRKTSGTYNLNKNRWKSNEDSVVLCYDEEGLYIGQGNSVDFSNGETKNLTPSVGTAKSFHEFMGTNDGNGKFYKVDIAGMKTINYEDLESAIDVDGGCPGGTIVKVIIAPGEYEYYVAIDPKGTKTQLSDILNYEAQDRDICGWWKLKIYE